MQKVIHHLKLQEQTETEGTGTFVTTGLDGWVACDEHHSFHYKRDGRRVDLVIDGLKRPHQILKKPMVETEAAVAEALESFYKNRNQSVWHPITENSRLEKLVNATPHMA